MSDHETGTLYAWGAGHTGMQGQGPVRSVLRPQAVPDLPPVRHVAAGDLAAYAVDTEGAVWSWGWDAYHHLLGRGSLDGPPPKKMVRSSDENAPVDGGVHGPGRIEGLPPIRSVAPGPETVIALTTTGEVWGWGGIAGLGTPGDEAVAEPRRIDGLSDIVAITVSRNCLTFLALDAQGRVWSWGDGNEGQHGWGKRRYQPTPEPIPDFDGVRSVHAAGAFCWAVRNDDSVWFWGNGQTFELMSGKSYRVLEPIRVEAFDGTAELFVGKKCVIARQHSGDTIGLGVGLGNLLEDEAEPGEVHLARLKSCDGFRSISLGDDHALAVDDNGRLHAFGDSGNGVLGNGQRNSEEIQPPEPIEDMEGVLYAEAGDGCSFAIVPT